MQILPMVEREENSFTMSQMVFYKHSLILIQPAHSPEEPKFNQTNEQYLP